MPPRPTWPARIPAALRQLEEAPRADYGRSEISRLFGVSPRHAHAILHQLGATNRRGALAIAHSDLVRALRDRRRSGGERQEIQRRERLVAALRRAPLEHFGRLPRPKGLELAGVDFAPGRITIEFQETREALQRLFLLAQAIQAAPAAFEEAVGHRAVEPPTAGAGRDIPGLSVPSPSTQPEPSTRVK